MIVPPRPAEAGPPLLALAPALTGHRAARRDIETAFEELRPPSAWRRSGAGGRTRCRGRRRARSGRTPPAAAPYQAMPDVKRAGPAGPSSDALAAVRRWRGAEGGFPQADPGATVDELPPPRRGVILPAPAPAA